MRKKSSQKDDLKPFQAADERPWSRRTDVIVERCQYEAVYQRTGHRKDKMEAEGINKPDDNETQRKGRSSAL